MKRSKTLWLGGWLAAMAACPGDDTGTMDDGSSTTGSTGSAATDASTGSVSNSSGFETTTGSASGSETGDSSPETTDGGVDPRPPLPCPDRWDCKEDLDDDQHPLVCDNAPNHTNPDQGDMDFDGFGDVIDLCPTVQSLNNTADSDRDGIGNDCDRCRMTPAWYTAAGSGTLPAEFGFVGIPDQGDADGDGIGDVCDNCVTVPNCLGFGEGTTHQVGTVIDLEDPDCQSDADGNYIGDACEGLRSPGAAGPVGFGPSDDFDQDGLPNADDSCPRQPVPSQSCNGSADCPTGATCQGGVCTHVDTDGDGKGNVCDNCPFTANADQADADGDFVGDACETNAACIERSDPRPFSFYDVSAGGWCCTTVYQGQGLSDPDGNPLDPTDLPELGIGVLDLPPGCDEALAQAGLNVATRLTLADVSSPNALWEHACLLPQWDQDFDAIGDACDLCPYAFDPTNAPYIDANGMVWPNDGAYCNGEYQCTNG